MSEEPKSAHELLMEKLAEPIPKAKPKAKPEPPSAEVVPLNPYPFGRRQWTAEPIAASSAVPYQPSELELYQWSLKELQKANARAARAQRRRLGPAWCQDETMEEIVRRQEGYDD